MILPDSEWFAHAEYFKSAWDFFPTGSGYRVRFAGDQIDIYAASAPPALPDERTIVLVDEALRSSYPSDLDSEGFELETELLARALRVGASIVEVPVSYASRQEGARSRLVAFTDAIRILRTAIRLRG